MHIINILSSDGTKIMEFSLLVPGFQGKNNLESSHTLIVTVNSSKNPNDLDVNHFLGPSDLFLFLMYAYLSSLS